MNLEYKILSGFQLLINKFNHLLPLKISCTETDLFGPIDVENLFMDCPGEILAHGLLIKDIPDPIMGAPSPKKRIKCQTAFY